MQAAGGTSGGSSLGDGDDGRSRRIPRIRSDFVMLLVLCCDRCSFLQVSWYNTLMTGAKRRPHVSMSS